jgi:hypothetical protein
MCKPYLESYSSGVNAAVIDRVEGTVPVEGGVGFFNPKIFAPQYLSIFV